MESQERIEQLLASEGTEEDWLKLMNASFWRSPFPDGRSSEAMAHLLEQLRSLRAHGLKVTASVPAVNRGVGRPGSKDNSRQGAQDAAPAVALRP